MKKQVAVLFGGRSSEHEISVITGLEVVEALDPEAYDAIPVYIDVRGRWFTGDELRDKSIYKNTPGSLEGLQEVSLLPIPGASRLQKIGGATKGFSLFGSKQPEDIPVDIFYPAFHGQFGEDGCIQGLLELAGVAYTGCGVAASAIAMDKEICKSLLKQYDIPSLPGVVAHKREMHSDIGALRKRITSTPGCNRYPLFVKPVHLGSSIAVSKADNDGELDGALAAVFERDGQAIIEPCITNLMEINVSVIEGEDRPRASVVEVPVASEGTLTYEDKYLRGRGKKAGSKSTSAGESTGMTSLLRAIDPEDLEMELKTRVREYAVRAYTIIGCAGIVRFDFMLDVDTNSLYFNELNPLPGSLAHYLWAKSSPNLLYTEMLDIAINGALARHESKKILKTNEGFKALN